MANTNSNPAPATTLTPNPPKVTKFQGEVVLMQNQGDYFRVELETARGDNQVVNIPAAFANKANLLDWCKLDTAVSISVETRIKGKTTYTDSQGVLKTHDGMTNEKSEVFAGISRLSKRRWNQILDDVNREGVKGLIEEMGANEALTVEQILAMRR